MPDPQSPSPAVPATVTGAELAEALDGFWLFVACGGQRVHGQVAAPDEVASVLLATLGRIAAGRSPEAAVAVPASPGEAGPDIGQPTAEDRALAARATGGGIRSREVQPQFGNEEDEPGSAEPHAKLLESAWGVIANAGWDDCAKTPGWQEAAVRWRDDYFRWVDLHLRPGGYRTWEELAASLTRERDALFAEVSQLRRGAQDAAGAVPALPVGAALESESIRDALARALDSSPWRDGKADAVMLDVIGPLLLENQGWRERAVAAEAEREELISARLSRSVRLARIAAHCRGHLKLPGSCCPHLAQEILAIIGADEEGGDPDDWSFTDPVL